MKEPTSLALVRSVVCCAGTVPALLGAKRDTLYQVASNSINTHSAHEAKASKIRAEFFFYSRSKPILETASETR